MGNVDIALGFGWYVVFVFSTVLHEAAHAFASWRLGDSTAYQGGQVSVNPVPHIRREPVGMVVVPIISFVFTGWMFGWASAPRFSATIPKTFVRCTAVAQRGREAVAMNQYGG